MPQNGKIYGILEFWTSEKHQDYTKIVKKSIQIFITIYTVWHGVAF